MGIETEKFVNNIDEDFICSICTLVLEDPIRISGCEHMFCRLCIDKWLKQDKTCPVDRKTVQVNDLIPPDRTVVNMLNKLRIKCEFDLFGCVDVVQLENWKSHVIDCDFNPENKWPCVGCGKIVTKKDDNNHRCIEKLIIEVEKLKNENEELKYLVSNFKTTNKKCEQENQKLKQEAVEQNNLIKQLVDENEDNLKKYKILLNENEALRLVPSTSTSSPRSGIPPFFKTDNLVVKSKQTTPKSKTESCSPYRTLENKRTTSSIDKWLILSRLPLDLKNRVQLASVLGTGNNFDAMIITKDNQVYWIKANKATVMETNVGDPVKISGYSGIKIKALEYGSGIGETFYVIALTKNGQLLTWSYSGHPLGTIGKNIIKYNMTPYFVNLPNQKVTQIVCGNCHVLAVSLDGNVYAFGENNVGQMGTDKKLNYNQPIKVKIKSGFQTLAVACCNDSSFAVMDNGDVFAWGDNSCGQLGLNNNMDQRYPMKIEALAGIKIRRLVGGQNHVLAVADDGSMFAWGLNCNGQLGTGDTINKNKPVKIGPSGVKFIKVAACKSSNFLSVALSEDGRCWVWGLCRTNTELTIKNVFYPMPVESKSIDDAIADYAIYQMTWKTMVFDQ